MRDRFSTLITEQQQSRNLLATTAANTHTQRHDSSVMNGSYTPALITGNRSIRDNSISTTRLLNHKASKNKLSKEGSDYTSSIRSLPRVVNLMNKNDSLQQESSLSHFDHSPIEAQEFKTQKHMGTLDMSDYCSEKYQSIRNLIEDKQKRSKSVLRRGFINAHQNPYIPLESPQKRSQSVIRNYPKISMKNFDIYLNAQDVQINTASQIGLKAFGKNWQSERKETFPIKKIEIVQDFNVIDQQSFINKCDAVIEQKHDKFYNYDSSLFRCLENTNQFRSKLDQLDEIMYNDLFKGTQEAIVPKYKYFKDEILDKSLKKKKLYNVNEDLKRKLKDFNYIRDHRGNIVTKSGSQFENLAQMLQRDEYMEQKRQERAHQKFTVNVTLAKSSEDGSTQGGDQFELNDPNFMGDVSLMKHRSKNDDEKDSSKSSFKAVSFSGENNYSETRKRSTSHRKTIFRSKNELKTRSKMSQDFLSSQQNSHLSVSKRSKFEKSFKTRTQSNINEGYKMKLDITSEMAKWLNKELENETQKQKYLDAFEEFRIGLEKQLNDESVAGGSEYSNALIDDEIQKKLYSSAYNEEFLKEKGSNEHKKQQRKIFRMLIGDDQAQNLTSAVKNNSSFERGMDQVQEKLDFMLKIEKAQSFLKSFIQKKKIKRLEHIVNTQNLSVVASQLIADLQLQESKNQQLMDEQEALYHTEDVQDAMKLFIKECTIQNIRPPSLYKSFEQNKLQLTNMNMQKGLCLALAKAIKRFIPHPSETIVFNNNSLTDENFAIILEALVEANGLKGIHSVNNQMGQASINELVKILKNPIPMNLQELILNGSKISTQQLANLLDSIKSSCQLKILGLSQQKFDAHSTLSLIHLIKNTHTLLNLDLSYGQFFKAKAIIDILKLTSTKHSIQYLNISFNTVKDLNRTEFANAIKSFITISMSLVHLNLSACGLNGQSAAIVIQSLKKSKTLQSLHFSGNQLDITTAQTLRKILNCRVDKQSENQDQDLYTTHGQLLPSLAQDRSKRLDSYGSGIDMQKQKTYEQKTKGSISDMHNEETNIHTNDQYIYSRHLGRTEIQKGHQWVERKQCWICEKWQYLLVIWSESLSNYFFEEKQLKHLQIFEDKIKLANPDCANINETTDLQPIILGPGTNFERKKMVPIADLYEKIERNIKPYSRTYQREEEQSRIDKLIQDKFIRAKQMISLLRGMQRRFQVNKPTTVQNEESSEKEQKNIYLVNKQWPRMYDFGFKNFEYKELPEANEIIKLKMRPDELFFAYADYYPPGQKLFIVQSKQLKQKIAVSHLNLEQRMRPIGLSFKKVKKTRINRNFQLKSSVFSQWALDMNQEYRKAFDADMRYSKIHKFIKDTAQYDQISNILLENYPRIFEVYLYCSGRSNYPSVAWIDFGNFCDQWKVIDKNLTLSTIDRLFIAVNFEGVPGGLDDNPDKELCRYEFFEIIVRMALAKYPNMQPPEALSAILHQYILCDPQTLSWFKFRQELIWTLEIDDLLKTNQAKLKKLFAVFNTSLKKTFTIEDAVDLLVKTPSLEMSAKEATLAHAYSKFLVTDEMASIDQLHILNFNEFQEFVARLGQIKYPDPQMILYDKIFKILTELLKLVGLQPSHPMNDDLGESESDYDDAYQ